MRTKTASDVRRLAALCWELFKISLFVVGGGYAIIIVADRVFSRRGWIEEGELLDRLPVFQMVPGLIATHTAVYMGRKVAGGAGAVAGVVAVALPSVAIFTAVSAGFGVLPVGNPWLRAAFTGLRCALVGIVGAAIVRSWRKTLVDPFAYALMAAAFVALAFLGVNVVAVLAVAMLAGLLSVPVRVPRGVRACVSPLPFLLFLKYGALCFGGGFVLVPMYIQDFVGGAARYLQLPEAEFANLMALTQMTPGPIGVNGATFFGYRLGGVAGAAIASAALLFPGSLLCYLAIRSLERFSASAVVRGVMRGVRPASVALMLVAFVAFVKLGVFVPGAEGACAAFSPFAAVFALAALGLAFSCRVNVMAVICFSAALGALVFR